MKKIDLVVFIVENNISKTTNHMFDTRFKTNNIIIPRTRNTTIDFNNYS